MNTHNMELLREKAAENGPLCIGLDTDPSYIPQSLLRKYPSEAEAVFAFNKAIIERTKNTAAVYKVQIAYYEALGIEGMKAYSKTLKALKEEGALAISDVKRGDIAATASAYARAHFSGDFESDIITVNPYMGFDTLQPFSEYCERGKGIFVLLRTSNPGMKDIEQQELKSGSRVLDGVGAELARLGEQFKPMFPDAKCSPVGAVVGCTEESDALVLRNAYPEMFFLIPGYGAQGGAARIAASLLGKAGGVVNSSRGILCAWKKDSVCLEKEATGTVKIADIADAAAKAALDAKTELLGAKNELWK